MGDNDPGDGLRPAIEHLTRRVDAGLDLLAEMKGACGVCREEVTRHTTAIQGLERDVSGLERVGGIRRWGIGIMVGGVFVLVAAVLGAWAQSVFGR